MELQIREVESLTDDKGVRSPQSRWRWSAFLRLRREARFGLLAGVL